MTRLRTARLILVPLSADQMRMQLDDFGGMERSLGLQPSGQQLDAAMRPVVQRSISYMVREPEHAIWFTNWVVLFGHASERSIVGGIGFKGPVTGKGDVEIGYGFEAEYRNQGFATEAAWALASWALDQPHVGQVLAETENQNVASMRVLEKVGFRPFKATSQYIYWRCTRADLPPDSGDCAYTTDRFPLFDLVVVVERIDGDCTCHMVVGDRFFLRNSSSLSLPDGAHFCVYALQAVLPLLPAKQRLNHPADWMETDTAAVCPDPACGLLMRIERGGRHSLRHDDTSPIPWESLT